MNFFPNGSNAFALSSSFTFAFDHFVAFSCVAFVAAFAFDDAAAFDVIVAFDTFPSDSNSGLTLTLAQDSGGKDLTLRPRVRYDETWGERRRAGKCSCGWWWRGLGLGFDESGI